MFEPIAVIVSLISLGVSWRAYLLSKKGYEIQSEAHGLQKFVGWVKSSATQRILLGFITFNPTYQLK
jgi:hypothetical protein